MTYHCFRMDVLVAVHILGEAAKASCLTLRTLQNLARGIRPKAPTLKQEQDDSGEIHLVNNHKKKSRVKQII